ncbi:lytic transglycosylase domain-containing protein [Chloroflexota bacterium]
MLHQAFKKPSLSALTRLCQASIIAVAILTIN